MSDFTFYQPTKLIFGAGKLKELGRLTAPFGKKCLLVTTTDKEEVLQPLYRRVKEILTEAGLSYIHFDKVVPNPDIKGIHEACEIVRKEKIEAVLAVGGGSSIDTAKAIALFWEIEDVNWKEVFAEYSDPFATYKLPGSHSLPVIAVPTTAGTGSELTQAMIISDQNQNDKQCVYHQAAFPKVAVIDPELCRTLSPYLTAITGFDAFTHAFESYMREFSSPYTELLGTEAMKIIVQVLPKLVQDTSNMEYREAMSAAAAFSGISLSNASATIPHPLSEVIGGIAPWIAHGQCLACLYPGYLRFQVVQTPEKCAKVARIFDPSLEKISDSKAALQLPRLMEDFLRAIGIYDSLSHLGVTKERFQEMKEHFIFNVLPFASKDVLLGIMDDAYKKE